MLTPHMTRKKYRHGFIVQHSAVTDMNGRQSPEIKILACMCLQGVYINIRVEPLKRRLSVLHGTPPGPLLMVFY